MTPSVDDHLVFDIGMHRGEDTAFYLSRGYRVVGVEANQALVERLHERFRAEVATGAVTIVPRALGPRPGTMPFAVAQGDVAVVSTADPGYLQLARRQGFRMEVVDVEVVTLPQLVERHGVPRYLKVDIEGLDHAVVATLGQLPARPPLLSMESATTGAGAGVRSIVAELRLLRRLGYRRFKLVDQSRLGRLEGTRLSAEGAPVTYAHERAASGPFGDEAPGVWRGAGAVMPAMLTGMARYQLLSPRGRLALSPLGARLRARARTAVKSVSPHAAPRCSWFDLHAAR